MSARVLSTESLTSAVSFFPSAPLFLPTSQSPAIVSSGQTHTRIFPVVAASQGPFTSYPPPKGANDDDEKLLYTYASVNEEPVSALSLNTRRGETWTLCIPVPIPSITEPTLRSLDFMIKYATTGDNGSSTIQTDTILTSSILPNGVVTDTTTLDIYRNKTGYAPRMVNHDEALRLSTTLAIKSNGGGDQWSHYVDNQHITPNVRIVDGSIHLYVVFHVCEYATLKTVRSLAVEVSATWQKDDVRMKAREEEERKTRKEAEKNAEEERKRRVKEEEERQARVEEKHARGEEKKAREEEKQAREESKSATKISPDLPTIPQVADEAMQAHIAETIDKLDLGRCSAGYIFQQTPWGYICSGGVHKVTWEQLGMTRKHPGESPSRLVPNSEIP